MALTYYPNNLRRERETRGWTQVEMAGRAGVNINTIRNIESGCRPNRRSARRILRALRLPLRDRQRIFPEVFERGPTE